MYTDAHQDTHTDRHEYSIVAVDKPQLCNYNKSTLYKQMCLKVAGILKMADIVESGVSFLDFLNFQNPKNHEMQLLGLCIILKRIC